jgi:hypothetical protein
MNMIPVMTSTKIDRSKIDLAGVDSGAKIFGIPADEFAGSAAATAVAMEQNKKANI